MSQQQVIRLLKSLPEEMQVEVIHFIEFLANKIKKAPPGEDQVPIVRKSGIRKGFIKYMAKDFDAPLDDFADYM